LNKKKSKDEEPIIPFEKALNINKNNEKTTLFNEDEKTIIKRKRYFYNKKSK
jgi:hypothetical protein